MAFLPNQQDEEQRQQGQQGQIPQIPLIPSLQGSAGPNVSQSGGTGVTNTATPGARPSAPWQNVTSYLQANAGQAGGVADVLAGNLTSQYNTANQGIQNAQTNFGQQIESARTPYNQQIADQAKAGHAQFVQDPQNVASFQKMYNAQYTGPQDFSTSSDYSNLASQVQKAQKQAGLLKQGTPGLMTLLQQAESAKGKNPTQGITALDSLLLQEDPSNFSKLESAASPFSNLTSYLSSTQQGLDTAAQSAAQEAAATQQKMRDAYVGAGGIVPTFNQGVNDAMQNASQKVTGYNQNIADIISDLNAGKALTNSYPDWDASNVDPSGTLSTLNPYGTSGGVFPSMLAMGLGAGVGPNYLTQFYNAPNQVAQPGLENVMTPEQWADAQALNQLIGPGTAQAPAALGQQFQVPSGYGSFDSQGALNGLYNSLKAQEAELPYMTQEQQSAWLGNMQLLGSYLGIPSTNYPNPQPISGTPPPPPGTGPGLGEGGGPPYLQPPVPGGGGDVSGGGRRFYSMGVS